MHAVWRAVMAGFVWPYAISLASAQTTELPPIFSPRPAEAAPAPAPPTRSPLVSERVRTLINAAAQALVENLPPEAADTAGAETQETPAGVMLMKAMVVKAQALRSSDLRPPVVDLFHFRPLGGDMYRRIAGGVTAPLYHTFIGNKELQVDFSILNGAGRGVDHNRDFTRGEISFTLKF